MIHEVFDSCLRAEQVLKRGDITVSEGTYTFDAAAYTMPYHDGGVDSTCEQRCFPRP